MRKIFKYPLGATTTTLELPVGAIFRAVQLQDDLPTLWFEIETLNPKETREFQVFCTGEQLPEGVLSYCGTFQKIIGNFVFVGHVYEIRKP